MYKNLFPYETYSIQDKLMTAIESTISQSKIGIFESPTGTGKSLSVLSASISWLLNNRSDYCINISNNSCKRQIHSVESDLPKWVLDYKNEDSFVIEKPDFGQKNKRRKIMPPVFSKKTVIFTSRTHSQLAQIMKEIKKLKNLPKELFGNLLFINLNLSKNNFFSVLRLFQSVLEKTFVSTKRLLDYHRQTVSKIKKL